LSAAELPIFAEPGKHKLKGEKTMNVKRISGLVIALIGAILLVYALYSMHRISEAKNKVHHIGKQIPGNFFGKAVKGELHKKVSQYDKEVEWLLIGGITFLVVGGGIIFLYRKPR
jgi:hypothetical protein